MGCADPELPALGPAAGSSAEIAREPAVEPGTAAHGPMNSALFRSAQTPHCVWQNHLPPPEPSD